MNKAERNLIAFLQKCKDTPATPPPVDANGLLPCPFCGWANPVWAVERHAYDWIEYAAYCANCDAKSKPSSTKEEAAEAWNRRTTTPPPVEWTPVDFIRLEDGLEIHVDNIAMTIGKGITALATHAWPEQGQYAICQRRTTTPGATRGAMPATVDDMPMHHSLPAHELVELRNASIKYFYLRVCRMAEKNMELTGTVSGAYWDAMQQVLAQMHIKLDEQQRPPAAPGHAP